MPGVTRKITKEKGHIAWRLLDILPNKPVSRTWAPVEPRVILARTRRVPSHSRGKAYNDPSAFVSEGTAGSDGRYA